MQIKTRMEVTHIPTGTVWIGNDVTYADAEAMKPLMNVVHSWAKMDTFTLIGIGGESIAFGSKLISESTCTLFSYDIE